MGLCHLELARGPARVALALHLAGRSTPFGVTCTMERQCAFWVWISGLAPDVHLDHAARATGMATCLLGGAALHQLSVAFVYQSGATMGMLERDITAFTS